MHLAITYYFTQLIVTQIELKNVCIINERGCTEILLFLSFLSFNMPIVHTKILALHAAQTLLGWHWETIELNSIAV